MVTRLLIFLGWKSFTAMIYIISLHAYHVMFRYSFLAAIFKNTRLESIAIRNTCFHMRLYYADYTGRFLRCCILGVYP
jgi:hypothetical protein